MKKIATLTLLLLAASGAGCSWLHGNSRPQWRGAVQEQPLQVPPDLQRPANAAALTIPDIPAQAAGSAAVVAPEPPGLQQAASTAANEQGSATLEFDDTVPSVFHRVGLALKRGDIAKLQSEDASAYRYEVIVTTQVVQKPTGFFARIFSGSKTHTVESPVTVQVQADGAKARVQLSGAAAAVRQLEAALRQQLG